MDAKSPAPCILRVEALEGRLHPSATSLLAGDGHSQAALASAPWAFAAHVAAPDRTTPSRKAIADSDEDEYEFPAVTTSAAPPAPAAAGADVVSAEVREREPDYDPRADRQLPRYELREKATYELSPTIAARTRPAESDPRLGTDESPSETIQHLPVNAVVSLAAPPSGEFAAIAIPAGTSTAELGQTASEPGCFEPQADPADVMPEAPRPTPPDAGLLDWHDAIDFLAGIPVAAVAVDAVAMRAEAEEFLARVADLAPAWAGDIDWSNCLWLTAGVLLTAGGVEFARATRRSRGAPELHLPPLPPPEGGR
jgi:hypothetical protein